MRSLTPAPLVNLRAAFEDWRSRPSQVAGAQRLVHPRSGIGRGGGQATEDLARQSFASRFIGRSGLEE